jgi:hypothetical protein
VFRDIDSADARGRLEEMTNATLAEHALGCTFGGGTGRRYAYIDLALTDVPRAIPVLRDFVRRVALSPRSWLLFFDAEYADEWVGLHERSPKPMLPS